MNIEPKLEALACSRNDIPAMATVCATPGVSRAISSTLAIASWVRCSDAESGNWTLTMSRPWSCCGMKPVGRCSKVQYGQHQQAAVDHEHDHAEPQQLADRPAVDLGHPVEQAVEAAEEPAQHGVDRAG